jgi:two-component system chemotaxis sensor kinase CheA
MEMNQYLAMFIEESKDHLQALNENLLKLESSPQDIAIVQNIFRSAHTLKGMSATMGFEDIASLTHEMENVLDLVRNNKLAMSSPIFDVLFKGLDLLENMVQDVVDGGAGKADVTSVVNVLKAIFNGDLASTSAVAKNPVVAETELDQFQYSVLKQSIESGHFVYYIKVHIREDCVLKAARAYMVFDTLERHGEVAKSTPTVQEIEQEKFDRSFTVYYISKENLSTVRSYVENVSEIDKVEIAPLDLESLQQYDSQESASPTSSSADAETAASAVATEQANTAKPSGNGGGGNLHRTIRVDIERLDVLMNLFSELLIDRVRLEVLADEIRRNDLTETVEHMTRVSSDLQNIVLKLRMVPVDSVFNRFPRMIRDLAKSLDKKVDLIVVGADTELDRTVIDEIGDPLVHLLRNSLDHGVESIADRISAGKKETGTIHLRAFHSGNHVFIEIEDDGRGINRDKVLSIAIKNGIVSSEQAKELSDEEIYQFLFAAGFSTADKISDISGRGVGLDVVKTKITSLGGNVTVTSKLGVGTKFSVQLPLTLSIIGGMLIRLHSEKFAIPLSSIVETAILPLSDIRKVHGKQMIDYRDSLIPLIDLDDMLECPKLERTRKEHEIIIIHKGDKLAAIIVDELLGQQEIVLKSLGQYLTNLFAISGATILGDGQVALILDTNALIK